MNKKYMLDIVEKVLYYKNKTYSYGEFKMLPTMFYKIKNIKHDDYRKRKLYDKNIVSESKYKTIYLFAEVEQLLQCLIVYLKFDIKMIYLLSFSFIFFESNW